MDMVMNTAAAGAIDASGLVRIKEKIEASWLAAAIIGQITGGVIVVGDNAAKVDFLTHRVLDLDIIAGAAPIDG